MINIVLIKSKTKQDTHVSTGHLHFQVCCEAYGLLDKLEKIHISPVTCSLSCVKGQQDFHKLTKKNHKLEQRK